MPRRALLPFLTLSLLFISIARSAERNLIPNGDFESKGEDGFAQGWGGAIDGKRNPHEMYVKEGRGRKNVHSGTHAMKLFVSKLGVGREGTRQRNVLFTIKSDGKSIIEPPIKLDPGKTYRLSFWIKREGFDDPMHQLVADFTGYHYPEPGDNRLSLAVIKDMRGACDWEKKEVSFTVSADSDIAEGYLIFRLFFPSDSIMENTSSVAYIDDVELIPEN